MILTLNETITDYTEDNFLLFLRKNKAWHFMWMFFLWIVCLAGDLHEMSRRLLIISLKKNKAWHFMWIVLLWLVCLADDLHEMSILIISMEK